MEENLIDIAEILKSYPKGTKLYSPICGECELDCLCYGDDVITVVYKGKVKSNYTPSELYDELDRNYILCFDKYGRYKTTDRSDANGEVMLFPSKNCRDWSIMKVTQNCNKENNNTKNSKEENKQKFKKGDFLKDEFGNIFICNEAYKTCWENEYLGVAFCVLFNNMMFADKDWIWKSCLVSYATEEEKQKFLKVIGEKGYIWDSEKLELRKNEPEFKPFDKVLVRDVISGVWMLAQYAFEDKGTEYKYNTVGGEYWQYCIPYEGNEHLLGTTENCK